MDNRQGLMSTNYIHVNNSTMFEVTMVNENSENLSHNSTTTKGVMPPMPGNQLGWELSIFFYSVIFLLAVVGNSLVIVTLVQNQRMRTVTNVFLLNLSISDLLLAVLCMPFTLVPTLLKDFIFGSFMCVAIRYLQGISVAVSAFTLVSISLERYFAICRPLRSRSWQTLSHSKKIIALVWSISAIVMIPIAVFQKLRQLRSGAHKCEERWPGPVWEKLYTLFLDLILLVLPLILMLLAYGKICCTLWKGIRQDMKTSQELFEIKSKCDEAARQDDSVTEENRFNGIEPESTRTSSLARRKREQERMRKSNTARSLRAKKRVIKMLFVVVLEFFLCWTPTYTFQTWIVFDRRSALGHVTPVGMNFIHLISYVSSCCNPITYCFMNRKFRQGFLAAFRCQRPSRREATWQRQQSEYSFGSSQRTDTQFSISSV